MLYFMLFRKEFQLILMNLCLVYGAEMAQVGKLFI